MTTHNLRMTSLTEYDIGELDSLTNNDGRITTRTTKSTIIGSYALIYLLLGDTAGFFLLHRHKFIKLNIPLQLFLFEICHFDLM